MDNINLTHHTAFLKPHFLLLPRQRCNVVEVANDAYDAAAVLCDGEYFDHPTINITAMDVTDDNIDTQVDFC